MGDEEEPVATMSGPLRLSGRRCQASSPLIRKEPPTARLTTAKGAQRARIARRRSLRATTSPPAAMAASTQTATIAAGERRVPSEPPSAV